MRPDSLSNVDYLLLSIGRVAQADVSLELMLRALWHSLADIEGRLDQLYARSSFAQIVEQTEESVTRLSKVPSVVEATARNVCQELAAVNKLRNRVVHDHWISPEGTVGYSSGHPDTDGSAWLRADLRTGVAELSADLTTQTYVDAA
jgi:hypothetical protein